MAPPEEAEAAESATGSESRSVTAFESSPSETHPE